MKEYNNQLTKLGYTIRKWREFKDIKQQDLALKINKDKSWLSHVENGKMDVTYTQILLMANALNIKPSALMEDFPNKMEITGEHQLGFPSENLNDLAVMMKDILYSIKEQKP
jgi:transcriptional regulator with XRE-family HTH domain